MRRSINANWNLFLNGWRNMLFVVVTCIDIQYTVDGYLDEGINYDGWMDFFLLFKDTWMA